MIELIETETGYIVKGPISIAIENFTNGLTKLIEESPPWVIITLGITGIIWCVITLIKMVKKG